MLTDFQYETSQNLYQTVIRFWFTGTKISLIMRNEWKTFEITQLISTNEHKNTPNIDWIDFEMKVTGIFIVLGCLFCRYYRYA